MQETMQYLEGEVEVWKKQFESSASAQLLQSQQRLHAVTLRLTHQDEALGKERAEHTEHISGLAQKLREGGAAAALDARASEGKALEVERAFLARLKAAEVEKNEAVYAAKEKMRLAAEQQFAKGRTLYQGAKKSLDVCNKALEAQVGRSKELKLELGALEKSSTLEIAALGLQLQASQEELEHAKGNALDLCRDKEEAIGICDVAVQQQQEAQNELDAALAVRSTAVSERESAFTSLATATQEIATMEAEVTRLKEELRLSSSTCEELFVLAESLQKS